mmetsp:Transcript_3193/g.12958  ORF Transcript_3193/g.12958 Transcript_3193/m.12958 type:complete len:231 (-) Transcript_3193:1361-2053(-)
MATRPRGARGDQGVTRWYRWRALRRVPAARPRPFSALRLARRARARRDAEGDGPRRGAAPAPVGPRERAHERRGATPLGALRPERGPRKEAQQVPRIPELHVEPAVVGDGSGGHRGHRGGQRRRRAPRLGRLPGNRRAAPHQRDHRILRRELGLERRRRAQGALGPHGARATRRRGAGGAERVTRPRRRDIPEIRRLRARGREDNRRRATQSRPVGAHRRVAAGHRRARG